MIANNLSLIMKLYYELAYHVKKYLVICTTQLVGGLLLKKQNHFEVTLNNFEFSRV